MAESDTHIRFMMDCRTALEEHFRDDPNVYVSGNNLMYYVEGNPRRSVSPDVYVVFGIPKHERPIYKLWEEGKFPDFALEITSSTTRRTDLGKKRDLYAALGVREYFLYDPLGDYLNPRLQGHVLDGGAYRPLTPDPSGTLRSETLRLELRLRDGELRFYDPSAERWLPTRHELYEAHQRAEAQAAAEAEARLRLEAEVARLRAELLRLQRQGGS